MGILRNDTCEKDNGNTVADTVAVDLFAEPHNNRSTCSVQKIMVIADSTKNRKFRSRLH